MIYNNDKLAKEWSKDLSGKENINWKIEYIIYEWTENLINSDYISEKVYIIVFKNKQTDETIGEEFINLNQFKKILEKYNFYEFAKIKQIGSRKKTRGRLKKLHRRYYK